MKVLSFCANASVQAPAPPGGCKDLPRCIAWYWAACRMYSETDSKRRQPCAQVMAEVMGAEAALVRAQFVSGTHAIATALFAVLRPGDELLAVVGKPYDTLEEVIGLRGTPGKPSIATSAQHLLNIASGQAGPDACPGCSVAFCLMTPGSHACAAMHC